MTVKLHKYDAYVALTFQFNDNQQSRNNFTDSKKIKTTANFVEASIDLQVYLSSLIFFVYNRKFS